MDSYTYASMTEADNFSALYAPEKQSEGFYSHEYMSNATVSNVYSTSEFCFRAILNSTLISSFSKGWDTAAYSGMSSNALNLNLPVGIHPSDSFMFGMDNQQDFGTVDFNLTRARSGSPSSVSSSLPTPGQLLSMLQDPTPSVAPVYDYMTPEVFPRTVAPSELHSPSVSPAHSRNGSMNAQVVHEQVYPQFISNGTEALYLKNHRSAIAPENQYTAHFYASTQGDGLNLPRTVLYSPLSSRRPSSQSATSPSSFGTHSRSPSAITCRSGRDDSGSSMYSPYTHGRTMSSSSNAISPIVVPVTPDIRATSISTDVPRGGSPAWSAASSNGTFSKFPLVAVTSPSSMSKKRKRTSISAVAPVSRKIVSMDSSEDEYVGVEDADASDEDFDDGFGSRKGKSKAKKMKGRTVKKQKGVELPNEESSNHDACTWNHRSALSTQHGAEIKVEQLIPIDRDTVSCPHCGFIPGNRRFSDLKRHWEAHLVKEAKDKVRWVCLTCGDVEEIVVQEEQEDGSIQTKSIKEYVPKVPVLKKYTRKDSARRHWKQDHGEKGMVWADGLVVQVDRVRGETTDGHDI